MSLPKSSGRLDVIVIGGGPAGSTAATMLAKHGYSVLLLERSEIKPTICTLAKILKKKENLAVVNEKKNDSKDVTSREILPKTAEKV